MSSDPTLQGKWVWLLNILILPTKNVMEMKYKYHGYKICIKYTKYVKIKLYALMYFLAQHATVIANESLTHWNQGIYVATSGPGQLS